MKQIRPHNMGTCRTEIKKCISAISSERNAFPQIVLCGVWCLFLSSIPSQNLKLECDLDPAKIYL